LLFNYSVITVPTKSLNYCIIKLQSKDKKETDEIKKKVIDKVLFLDTEKTDLILKEKL
jgi:hypothetical protein